jgi:hypothetical protein
MRVWEQQVTLQQDGSGNELQNDRCFVGLDWTAILADPSSWESAFGTDQHGNGAGSQQSCGFAMGYDKPSKMVADHRQLASGRAMRL